MGLAYYLAMYEEYMYDSKPAVKSLSILGSISSIGTLLALVNMVLDTWDRIPPELIQDTKTFLTITIVAVVQQALALVGRWRATAKIQGVFK